MRGCEEGDVRGYVRRGGILREWLFDQSHPITHVSISSISSFSSGMLSTMPSGTKTVP